MRRRFLSTLANYTPVVFSGFCPSLIFTHFLWYQLPYHVFFCDKEYIFLPSQKCIVYSYNLHKPLHFPLKLESYGTTVVNGKYDKSFLNLNIYRGNSYNPKTTDQERKVEELSQELKSLKEETCNKDKR